jgi:hypothetical protein
MASIVRLAPSGKNAYNTAIAKPVSVLETKPVAAFVRVLTAQT